MSDLIVEHIYESLFLASTHVLIENWDKLLAYDDVVDRLLKKRGRRDAVHELRNSTFHHDPLLDPRNVLSRRKLPALLQWADEVVAAMRAHLRLAYAQGLVPRRRRLKQAHEAGERFGRAE